MVDFKKAAKAAVGVTGIAYGLGFLYNKFFAGGIATLTFSVAPVDVNVKEAITQGIDTSLAGKVLSYLGGVIPSGGTIAALLTLFVASFLVVALAQFIAGSINLGKSEAARFGMSMGISAAALGMIAGTMSPSIGSLGTGIAMLIYFGIIAFAYVQLRKVNGIRDFFPVM